MFLSNREIERLGLEIGKLRNGGRRGGNENVVEGIWAAGSINSY